MLARLQQGLTLGALLVSIAWGVLCWRAGNPVWGAAGAAMIMGAYAVVLGLEFILLGWAHGEDPTPKASARQRLRAWADEVRAAPTVFCWRQPFRSDRWPDKLGPQGRGVVLVHGFVCNRGLWNRWLARLTASGTPFVAVNLEPVFGAIDDYPAIIEAAVRRLERCTGLAPVVVAHSMGGLAVRRWWADQPDATRVHHIITIASPHHGTWLARFALSPNTHQMQQSSVWLQQLAARELPERALRMTCFYSHCDNIVFPPATATLKGASNRHLPGVAHVHMADRPEPWLELQRVLTSTGAAM
jgi:pimeloyl-ACP methyl ester carboxylesterase